MNIFVLSWLAPNHYSQEGFSLLKLMKNSDEQYYVCCNEPDSAVREETEANASDNVRFIFLNESSSSAWAEAGVNEFKSWSKQIEFDCLMTVSLPPESIAAGKKIKEEAGGIKWIAMLNSPIARNSYEISELLLNCPVLSDYDRQILTGALLKNDENTLSAFKAKGISGIEQYLKNRDLELLVRKNADLIITPSAEQFKYMLDSDHWMPKFKVIPPCIDTGLFTTKKQRGKSVADTVSFTIFATGENSKTLESVIRAVRKMKESSSPALKRIAVNVVGDYCPGIPHLVLNYYLDDVFSFTPSADYASFFKAIDENDWVILLDEYHDYDGAPISCALNSSVADSIGCGKPVLAVTKKNTPVYNMVSLSGGLTCEPDDINQIALSLEEIVSGKRKSGTNYLGDTLSASVVAHDFDSSIEELCSKQYISKRTVWPQIKESCDDKILSVCIPSYNAQVFLDRCIFTLINHEMAPFMEVIVVNDGSKDHTLDIGREYESRYPGIVRVIDKENGGHGSTINRAIKEAKGLFFKNVDSDDWVDSENLAKLIKYLSQNKEIDAISSDYDEVDLETGAETPMCAGKSIEYGKIYSFRTVNVNDIYFTIHSLTIKTHILKEMGIELQHHTFFVDCEYILFPVPSIDKFVFLPDHIYKYSRGNPEQSVDITNMVRRYDHHDRVVRRCIEYGITAGLNPAQKAYYDATLKRILWTHFALSLVYDQERERGMERAKDFYSFLKEKRPDLAEWVVEGVSFVKPAFDSKFDCGALDKQQRKNEFKGKVGRKVKRIYQKIRNA